MRTFDIAVFRVVTLDTLSFLPGQSVAIESEMRPRIWRLYSIANAPREDATMEFHVRVIDGGALSLALARGLTPGSRLRLGPPVGSLTLDTGSSRNVLLVAGSTGLAPLKAIAGQIAERADPPETHLFVGAQDASGPVRPAGSEQDRRGVSLADHHAVRVRRPGLPRGARDAAGCRCAVGLLGRATRPTSPGQRPWWRP